MSSSGYKQGDRDERKEFSNGMPTIDELISLDRVQRYTDLPKSTIYCAIASGKFAKHIRLSPGRVGWLRSEVEAWMAERCRAQQLN